MLPTSNEMTLRIKLHTVGRHDDSDQHSKFNTFTWPIACIANVLRFDHILQRQRVINTKLQCVNGQKLVKNVPFRINQKNISLQLDALETYSASNALSTNSRMRSFQLSPNKYYFNSTETS